MKSMAFPYGETVTQLVRTATGKDAYGNKVYGEVPVTVDKVGVAPRDANGSGGNESVQGHDTVTVGLTLLMPAGSAVASLDRFIVRGVTYEVDGQPEALLHPMTGWNPGLPVALKRVTG